MDVFFFKQKTASKVWYGLVGTEMCVRDSHYRLITCLAFFGLRAAFPEMFAHVVIAAAPISVAVSYTPLTLQTTDLV